MRTKKRLFYPCLITAIGILLCVTISGIFVAIKNIKVDSTSEVFSNQVNLFFLTINNCSTEIEGVQLGKDAMMNNCSGYVWQKGDLFYIIDSIYANENDAKLVLNKQFKNEINAEIINVNFPSISFSNDYSNEEKNGINSAINSFFEAYTQLFDISISFDNQHTNEISANLSINNVIAEFEKTKNNFETLFKNSPDNFTSQIKRYLTDGYEVLSLLKDKTTITPTQTFSSLIKYRYCELIHIYYNLINEFI